MRSLLIAAVAVLPPAGGPAAVEVTLLETTAGRFAAFGEPATGPAGGIVFHAVLDGGGDALCVSGGGVPRIVAQTGSSITANGRHGTLETFGRRPGLDGGLDVAFTATFREGGQAVLLAHDDGAWFERVADGGEAFRQFGDQAAVVGAATVLFHAEIDPRDHPDRLRARSSAAAREAAEALPPPPRLTVAGRAVAYDAGLFRDRGRRLEPVVRTDLEWLDVADGFAVNASGFVAFRAARRVGEWGLWLAANGAPRVLATTGAEIERFGIPALNEPGMVACSAALRGGGAALLRGRFGQPRAEVVVGRDAGFVALSESVSLDPAGRIAFVAHGGAGGDALLLAPAVGSAADATPQPLLAAGAAVAGRRVAEIALSNAAFVRADRLVVRLRFDDGVEAIALLWLRR